MNSGHLKGRRHVTCLPNLPWLILQGVAEPFVHGVSQPQRDFTVVQTLPRAGRNSSTVANFLVETTGNPTDQNNLRILEFRLWPSGFEDGSIHTPNLLPSTLA